MANFTQSVTKTSGIVSVGDWNNVANNTIALNERQDNQVQSTPLGVDSVHTNTAYGDIPGLGVNITPKTDTVIVFLQGTFQGDAHFAYKLNTNADVEISPKKYGSFGTAFESLPTVFWITGLTPGVNAAIQLRIKLPAAGTTTVASGSKMLAVDFGGFA